MENDNFDKRARTRELAAEFADRGDATGWFEALYKEAEGDNEKLPWGDLEPNRFFRAFAERTGLNGNGRKALVVGCGLGDDAAYLDDLGFAVTAFDISSTAIEWAKKLHTGKNIDFRAVDLFDGPSEWNIAENPVATASGSDRNTNVKGFEFVLEIYTIQPLPMEMRERTVDAVARFVAPGGELVVVTRGREDDEEPEKLPWPLSRKDLSRFEHAGLTQTHFEIMPDDTDDEPADRFVVVYQRAA
jgi:SAM-dependent methyltransferase